MALHSGKDSRSHNNAIHSFCRRSNKIQDSSNIKQSRSTFAAGSWYYQIAVINEGGHGRFPSKGGIRMGSAAIMEFKTTWAGREWDV